MPRTKDNILFHELIGLKVKIVSHLDPTLVNREGIVVDETMYMLKIFDNQRKKVIMVPKHGGIFSFVLPESGEEVIINGAQIIGRPEDRLKKIKFIKFRKKVKVKS
ncbi:MAG: ribonuclease P protein subunit [Ignisphaera sp.]|nr:ribonuclease P protein subunit [Ignisphaera sp.]